MKEKCGRLVGDAVAAQFVARRALVVDCFAIQRGALGHAIHSKFSRTTSRCRSALYHTLSNEVQQQLRGAVRPEAFPRRTQAVRLASLENLFDYMTDSK